jgi:hypothetical protein
MEEQFGEMVKIVKIHHLHRDGEEEMKVLQLRTQTPPPWPSTAFPRFTRVGAQAEVHLWPHTFA